MRVSHKNKFLSRAFVLDPAPIEYFSYEVDTDSPRVIVSETPEIRVQDFGDHVGVKPFDMETEEQFSNLALRAIVKAAELNNRNFTSFDGVADYFTVEKNMPVPYTIIAGHEPFEQVLREIFEFDLHLMYNGIIFTADVPSNEVYLITDPEHFGVISARIFPDSNDEWYGIGVMNVAGVVKVIL